MFLLTKMVTKSYISTINAPNIFDITS